MTPKTIGGSSRAAPLSARDASRALMSQPTSQTPTAAVTIAPQAAHSRLRIDAGATSRSGRRARHAASRTRTDPPAGDRGAPANHGPGRRA